MEKPSDLFWNAVPEGYTRGEAQEDLAFMVLRAAEPGEDDGCDGVVCDALTFALDRVWKGKEDKFKEALEEFLEEDSYDEEE